MSPFHSRTENGLFTGLSARNVKIRMAVEAPQRPLFIVGKLSMPLNSFSSLSGTFRCPSISSCHRRERFDAPQFLLPAVGSLLMPLNRFPTKIWNRRCPSLGITATKLLIFLLIQASSPRNLHKSTRFYVIFTFQDAELEEICVILPSQS